MVSPKIQPFHIEEVSDPSGGLILELRANGLRLATARATADMLHDMAVTKGLGRDQVRELLKTSLNGLQLAPELERQVFGYWFGPGESVPPHPVGWPTGAVLPAIHETFAGNSDLVCLDLVPVHNFWMVLSERGQYTYRHTSGLLNGEEWRFVPVKDVVGSWPVEFVATLDSPITTGAAVESRYGFEAATRARIDADAVQLRLRRL